MKITVVGRQMSVPDDIRALAEKKLAKLDKYFSNEGSATVTFSRKRNNENIEITISAANTLFRSETSDETFRNALDKAVDNIDRQIRKNKTRLEKKMRSSISFPAPEEPAAPQEEELLFDVRTKSFPLKPMTVDEAILQMNLLGHSFYLFFDAQSEETCAVYKRRDGAYGLIVPQR